MKEPVTETRELLCYRVSDAPTRLLPARSRRRWMDDFPDAHPYRCLPLRIANACGWEVVLDCGLRVAYDGGMGIESVRLEVVGSSLRTDLVAESNFARGIVTLQTGFQFATPEGWQLLVTGPTNDPIDGLSPLSGIVETDWLPYPFTMNWVCTRRGVFEFKKGSAICTILPLRLTDAESWQPVVTPLAAAPAEAKDHAAFRAERESFRARLSAGDEVARKDGASGHYMKGEAPGGVRPQGDHRRQVRLASPVWREVSKGPDDARRP